MTTTVTPPLTLADRATRRDRHWLRWLAELQETAAEPLPLHTEGTLLRVTGLVLEAAGIRVLVHPDDPALVAQGAGDALAARGARLMADVTLQRGGCRIESDLGSIDARIETRWAQAAQTLGQAIAFEPETPA